MNKKTEEILFNKFNNEWGSVLQSFGIVETMTGALNFEQYLQIMLGFRCLKAYEN